MDFGVVFVNLVVVAVLLLGVGLTVLGLPGNGLIFLTALAYGWYDKFSHLDTVYLVWLFGALIAGEAAEFAAGLAGARKQQASGRAIAGAYGGAIAGGILGSAVFPLLGSLLGAVVGAVAGSLLAEHSKDGDWQKAWQVAKSVAAGMVVGTVIKIAVAVGMVTSILSRLPWS